MTTTTAAPFGRLMTALITPMTTDGPVDYARAAGATAPLVGLAETRRLVGVKAARGDLAATSQVFARSDLAYYSGEDPMTLPLWSVGAVGCISVTGHVVGDRIHAMLEAFTAGRN